MGVGGGGIAFILTVETGQPAAGGQLQQEGVVLVSRRGRFSLDNGEMSPQHQGLEQVMVKVLALCLGWGRHAISCDTEVGEGRTRASGKLALGKLCSI